MLRRLATAALVAFATVAPASAEFITYNVSTTAAIFSGASSLGFADGPGALALNATFTVDTSQALLTPFGFYQSQNGTAFVSSRISDQGAGLPSTLLNIASNMFPFGGYVGTVGNDITARDQIITDVLDANGVLIGSRRVDVQSTLFQQGNGPREMFGAMSFLTPIVGDLTRMLLAYRDETEYFDGVTPSMVTEFTIDATGIYGAQASDSFDISSEGPTDAPEPASLALLGLGLAGMAVRRRWRVAA